MKYVYYAVFEYSSDEEMGRGIAPIGVCFPDFLGCVSVGINTEHAIEMANEVLKLHIEGEREDKKFLPKPSDMKILERKLLPHEKLFEITVEL